MGDPVGGYWALLRDVPHSQHIAWARIHRASFGLIYGAILVLSLLMEMDAGRDRADQAALALFGSVLAVTLAKLFSEVLAHAMETGERILTRKAFLTAWQHSYPTLLVVNVPTTLFLAAGRNWLSMDAAAALAQGFCVVLLVVMGARVGWVIGHGWVLSMGGALFAGGVGLALAALKHAMH